MAERALREVEARASALGPLLEELQAALEGAERALPLRADTAAAWRNLEVARGQVAEVARALCALRRLAARDGDDAAERIELGPEHALAVRCEAWAPSWRVEVAAAALRLDAQEWASLEPLLQAWPGFCALWDHHAERTSSLDGEASEHELRLTLRAPEAQLDAPKLRHLLHALGWMPPSSTPRRPSTEQLLTLLSTPAESTATPAALQAWWEALASWRAHGGALRLACTDDGEVRAEVSGPRRGGAQLLWLQVAERQYAVRARDVLEVLEAPSPPPRSLAEALRLRETGAARWVVRFRAAPERLFSLRELPRQGTAALRPLGAWAASFGPCSHAAWLGAEQLVGVLDVERLLRAEEPSSP